MLTVYVPRPGSTLEDRVWPGSGMVGSPVEATGRLRVDFEGDTDRYPRYADRVRRAAERHRWAEGHRAGYPTRAAAHVDETEVIPVGRYESDPGRVIVDDAGALKRWLGTEDLADEQLRVRAE